MQIIGFVTLLSGTMVYNELIKIPGLKYEVLEDDDKAAALNDEEAEEGYGRLMADADAMGSLNSTAGGRRK